MFLFYYETKKEVKLLEIGLGCGIAKVTRVVQPAQLGEHTELV